MIITCISDKIKNFLGCVDSRKKHDESKQELRLKRALKGTALSLLTWATAGWGGLLLYAFFHRCPDSLGCPNVYDMFSNGLLLSLASASVGGLLGFLFGIPPTLTRNAQEEQNDTKDTTKMSGTGTNLRNGGKTNIEEIADWLTKILIGAGLVELQNIGDVLGRVATRFQSNLGNNELMVHATIINFGVLGFFAGYLFTYLFLRGAFRDADSEMLAEAVARDIRTGTGMDPLEIPSHAEQAKDYYKQALASIDVNKVKDSKRRAYEGLVLNSLYDNYEDAIKYATQYQAEESGNPSPLILAYLGFAFGQQYKEAQKAKKSDSDLELIRRKALDSITKALRLEPNLKPLIRMVWDPNDVAKFPGSEDDDLEVFKDDPEFKALLE